MATFELPYGREAIRLTVDDGHLDPIFSVAGDCEEAHRAGRDLKLTARVVFVSDCDDQIVRDMYMIPARSAEEAMSKAKELVGRADYTVTVVPDGVSVIVK